MGRIVEWTPSEIETLRRYYPESDSSRLSAVLPGRSLSAIRRKASKLGLHRSLENGWSEEEIDILIRNYGQMYVCHIMPLLPGRSKWSIYRKAAELNLSAYTNEDTDNIIRENISTCSLSLLARRVGSSLSSVRYRARVMGLI